VDTKKCPLCAKEIPDEAIVCKHCWRELKGQLAAAPETKAWTHGKLALTAAIVGVGQLIVVGVGLATIYGFFGGGDIISGMGFVLLALSFLTAPVAVILEVIALVRKGIPTDKDRAAIGLICSLGSVVLLLLFWLELVGNG